MNTYADYMTDSGLGDVGGSEIRFVADDETVEVIEEEIASTNQCGPSEDGPDGSDSGLTQFWSHVERVIRRHAAEVN